MAPFELLQPASLGEALTFLDAADARAFSGGTALMLMMKAGVLRPKRLVSLRRLGMERIQANGSLRIGAMTTLRSLETSDAVRQGWPVIARTLRMLSNVRVRNVATVGGALAHADPHMDLPPLFCALGARVTIEGKEGRRTAPVEDLYAGYLETTLKRWRADHGSRGSGARQARHRLPQMHHAFRRRLAGGGRRGGSRG